MKIFDSEFVESYRGKEVPFGPLGYITYKRTYSRFLEDLGRSEEWHETCERVLSGNYQLEMARLGSNADIEALREEAKQAYDDMFHLRWLPPGRGLWASGSEVGQKIGAPLTNCWFVEVKPKDGKASYPFTFAMDMLMLGGGVGFSVSEQYVSQFAPVKNPVDLFIVCKESHRDYQFLGAQNTEGEWWERTHQKIRLEDSRRGWIYGLKKVIDAAFLSARGATKTLVIDISDIRPSGDRIAGFGGTSSGPAPLVELLRGVNRLLNARAGRGNDGSGGRLTSVDLTDLMNMIGRCVVSGNVRRSAMIALGDGGDSAFVGMKNPIDTIERDILGVWGWTSEDVDFHNWAIQNHRWASNNSILVGEGFAPNRLAESIWVKGEPGFINLDLVQNYGRVSDGRNDGIDGKATGTNPCGEISLESFEPCNLAEIFPSNCRSWEEVKRCAIHAYRYAKRVTLSHYHWPESQEVVERNRRVGVSISGIQDWLLALDGSTDLLVRHLDELYKIVRKEDERYSEALGINTSIKLTTVKPSGTISLLAGVSPGIHFPYADYYIRRIQFHDTDPLLPYLESLGFRLSKAVQTPNAIVVQFPIKSANADHPGFRSAGQASAREQLGLQYIVQKWWADNQVSCTVSLQEGDKEELPELIEEFSKKLKSTSFLPYTPAIKDHYPDLPYEPISKEDYEAMLAEIKAWPSSLEGDKGQHEVELDECLNGSCPIK